MMIKTSLYVLQALLGAIFIGYLLYNRIFRLHLPKDLTKFTVEQLGFFLFMTIITIILLSIVIYNYDKNYDFVIAHAEKQPEKPVKWYAKYLSQFFMYIKDSIFTFYCLLITYKPFMYFFNIIVVVISSKLYNKEEYYQRIIYIMFVLPRIIVSIIFLIDIFYFQELRYFYKGLILYLLPIIFTGLCAMFEEYYERMNNLWFDEYLEETLDAENTPCLTHTSKAPCSYADFTMYEYPFLKFVGSLGYFGKNYIVELKKKSLGLIIAQIGFLLGWRWLLILSIHYLLYNIH